MPASVAVDVNVGEKEPATGVPVRLDVGLGVEVDVGVADGVVVGVAVSVGVGEWVAVEVGVLVDVGVAVPNMEINADRSWPKTATKPTSSAIAMATVKRRRLSASTASGKSFIWLPFVAYHLLFY